MKTKWKLVAVAALLAAAAGVALAQRGMMGDGGMMGGMMSRGMMGDGGMMGGGMERGVPNEQWRGRDALPPPDETKRSAPRKPPGVRGPAQQGDTERDARR